LGRAIAEAALAAGDSVVAGARRTEELAPLVAQYGQRVKPVMLEVREEAAAKAAVQIAMDTFGRLDVLHALPMLDLFPLTATRDQASNHLRRFRKTFFFQEMK
jgi:NAD(P)-dependent dehydrogenase (short-subunit alcohol dehydrogenase family)